MEKLLSYSIDHYDIPPGFEQFDASIWKPAATNDENGLKIVGTPIETPKYVAKYRNQIIEDETQLLIFFPQLESLQIAWLLLYHCAVPRINHLLRTIAPSLINSIDNAHDTGILSCCLLYFK